MARRSIQPGQAVISDAALSAGLAGNVTSIPLRFALGFQGFYLAGGWIHTVPILTMSPNDLRSLNFDLGQKFCRRQKW